MNLLQCFLNNTSVPGEYRFIGTFLLCEHCLFISALIGVGEVDGGDDAVSRSRRDFNFPPNTISEGESPVDVCFELR